MVAPIIGSDHFRDASARATSARCYTGTCSTSQWNVPFAPEPTQLVDRLLDRACRKYTLPLWCPDRYTPFARAPRFASLIISVFVRIIRLAVYSQAQFFADFEERHFFGRHRNQGAAFGIASLPCAAVLDNKTAKAADLDTVALRQRFHHRIENCINDYF